MTGAKDKVWFRRGGLFAKYVAALVGLVVFVLAVNAAVDLDQLPRRKVQPDRRNDREGGSYR
jgi:hypothetical protein